MSMNFHFRARFLFLLVLALLIYARAGLTGLVLEPVLEGTLTKLMGMEVSIENLRVDVLTGHVSTREVLIMNQPEFSRRPHLKGRLEFDMDFLALLRKEIKISQLTLHDGYFLIEKNIRPDGYEITNIRTWINYVDPEDENEKTEEEDGGSGWKISLKRQVLDDVVFIYESYYEKDHELCKRYVFQNLYGELDDFEWPTEDPGKLIQPVSARGLIGLENPVPVWAKGMANFASTTVSFDLTGEIYNGSMSEYPHFWTGLPVKVIKGDYDLEAHAVCDKGQLKWDNRLIIRDLKLKYKRTAAGLIWGLPIQASVKFLESQKAIELHVPVQGDISDPNYDPGLGQAFQEALTRFTQGGLGMVGGVTVTPAVKVVETVSKAVKTAAGEIKTPWEKETSQVENTETV